VLLLLFVFLQDTVIAGNYYDFQLMARSGDAGLTGIKIAPSINEFAAVAFIGRISGGEGVFVAADSMVRNISPSRNFTAVQLNKAGKVVTRDNVGGTVFHISVWDSAQGTEQLIDSTDLRYVCSGGDKEGQACSSQLDCPWYDPTTGNFTYVPCIQRGQTYTGLLFPSINNLGQVAYRGDTPQFNYLVTKGNLGNNRTALAPSTMRAPMIADNGLIVANSSVAGTDPIRLYSADLASYEVIADAALGFTATGLLPGISRDGRVVAFAGNRGNGQGVFISLKDVSGNRIIIRVAGENHGLSGPRSELGSDDQGQPLFFDTFDVNSHIGVIVDELGKPGFEDDNLSVCFVATPNAASGIADPNALRFTANRGLWTVRVNVTPGNQNPSTLEFSSVNPKPVIQIGDTISTPSGMRMIDSLAISDQLASRRARSETSPQQPRLGDHQLVFQANSGAEQFVVRGTPCACGEPTIPSSSRADFEVTADEAHGWSMKVHVSESDGVVLKDVRLGKRYMAKEMAIPYFKLQTSQFPGGDSPARCELKADGTDASARSRLIGLTRGKRHGASDPYEPYAIEATYAIDRIGRSCLAVTQEYLFFPLLIQDAVELSGFFRAQRFFPIVKYQFCPRDNEELESFESVQRIHFQVDGMSMNSCAYLLDEPLPIPVDYKPYVDWVTTGLNPEPEEYFTVVTDEGVGVRSSDSIHQTYNTEIDEPAPSGIRPAGCPECVHVHWRWLDAGTMFIQIYKLLGYGNPDFSLDVFQGYPFRSIPFDGSPIIPRKSRGFSYDSRQHVEVASVVDKPEETDPLDLIVTTLPNRESLVDVDQVFWYSGRSSLNEDAFFVHGGFFAPTLDGADVTRLLQVDRNAQFVETDGWQEVTLSFVNVSQSTIQGPVFVLLNSEEFFNLENLDGYETVRWPRDKLISLIPFLTPPLPGLLILGTERFSERPPFVELAKIGDEIPPLGVFTKTFRFKTRPHNFPISPDSFKIHAGKVEGLPFRPSAFLPTITIQDTSPTGLAARREGGASGYELTVTGPVGFTYLPTNTVLQVDVSTNLVHWQPFRQISPTNTVITINDIGTVSAPNRFYRLTWGAFP